MLKNYSSSEGVTADALVYKGTKVGFRLELNTFVSRFFITSLFIFIFFVMSGKTDKRNL